LLRLLNPVAETPAMPIEAPTTAAIISTTFLTLLPGLF